jgi:HEAT repeat protein
MQDLRGEDGEALLEETASGVAAIQEHLAQARDEQIQAQLQLLGAAAGLSPDDIRGIVRRWARRAGLISDEDQLTEYRRRVAERYQYVDFVGITQQAAFVSLPLDEVFVPLSAAPAGMPRTALGEEHQLPEQRRRTSGRWERRQAEAKLRAMGPDRVREGRGGVSITEILHRHRRVVILGDPGSGKTTLVKWLARQCALDRGRLVSATPIVVPLADYGRALQEDPGLTLAMHVRARLEEHEGPGLGDLAADWMGEGDCLVLLDGLDEILDPRCRSSAARGVAELIVRYPANRYVVTSRIVGYASSRIGGNMAHCTLRGLEDHEIRHFARQWWQAYERARHPEAPDSAEADRQAEELVAAIFHTAHPQVREFARNPLLLTILALTKWQRVTLPERRVELYDVALRTLMESWVQARSLSQSGPMHRTDLDVRQSLRVWQRVAYWMHRDGPAATIHRVELIQHLQAALMEEEQLPERQAEETAEGFLRAASEQTGLLQARGEDAYSFLHQIFQEYLAARHAARPPHNAFERIANHLHDPRWREVILLTAGYVGAVLDQPECAGSFVDALRRADSSYEDTLRRDLLLAAGCLADRTPVDPRCVEAVSGALCDALVSPATALELLPQLSQALEQLHSARAYAIRPDRLLRMAKHIHPDVRRAAVVLLSDLRSTAVQDALEAALGDGSERVAVVAAAALAARGHMERQVISTIAEARLLPAHELDWVRRQLQASGKTEAVTCALVAHLEDGREEWASRSSAAEGVARLGAPCEALTRALLGRIQDRGEHVEVRWGAVVSIGSVAAGDTEVACAMVRLLEDETDAAQLRWCAASALAELRVADESVMRALITRLEDRDEDMIVRSCAAGALVDLGEGREAVTQVVVGRLLDDDEHWYVHMGVASALERVRTVSDAVVRTLASRAANGNLELSERILSVSALGRLRAGGGESVRALVGLLENRDLPAHVRWSAADALGQVGVGSESAVRALVAQVEDCDEPVRWSAARALVELEAADSPVIDALVSSLEGEDEEDWEERDHAARVLPGLVPLGPEPLLRVRSLLSHHDPDRRYAAATVLAAHESAESAVDR